MRSAGYLVYIAIPLAVLMTVPLTAQAVVSSGGTSTASIVNLELKNTPIKDAIGALFEGTGLKFYIQPGVSGRVIELKLKGVTIDQAMAALADAAGLVYKVDGGCYTIGPAPTSYASQQTPPAPAIAQPQASPSGMQAGAGPAPAMQQPPMMMPERLPPIEQRIEGGSANVVINSPPQDYGGGGYGGYGGGGCGGYGGCGNGSYQFGSVGVIGGWPGISVIGASPYMIQSVQPPPPPPGWVGPDMMRFLRTQYSIRSRIGITYPYYYNYGNGYGY